MRRGWIPGRTLSVACGDSCSPFCRLAATSSPGRGKSFHSGGALGKEGKFRPHPSTAGRSQPLNCKLYASAKASPFRERWHGEAVTERVASRTNPLSLAALDSSPEGRALGKEGKFRPLSSTAGRSLPLSCKLFALAKASPFRERWHGEAVTERVASEKNPLSRLRRQLFSFLSPAGRVFRNEPLPSFRFAKCHLPRRWRPWQRGQVSSLFVNGRKKSAVKLQTFRLCQSLSLSGEVARRSRDGEGLLPLPNFFQNFLLSVQETSPLLRVRIQRGTQSTRKASLASLCPQPYRKEAVQA